jgi:hypothetical protein
VIPISTRLKFANLTTARRGIPSLLIGFVTLLNGTVMLLGPGLHGLPGWGHCAVAGRVEESTDHGPHFADAKDSSEAHCPVCEFLAHGQLPTEPVSVSTTVRSTSCLLILSRSSLELRREQTFGSRAPPAIERS